MNKNQEVSERAQKLLKMLVERYIREGQPVGSKALAEEKNIALSSATIRNVLADLEERGYLRSPHTSAGRVPTAQGLRFFVDSLVSVKPLDAQKIQQFQQELSGKQNTKTLIESASSILSDITKLAGIVSLPARNRMELRQVEFIPLSGNRILTILVFKNGEVQNRIIYTDKPYSKAELQQAANYITEQFSGYELTGARQKLLTQMREDRQQMDTLMQTITEMAEKTFRDADDGEDFVLAGESNLLDLATKNMDDIKAMFEAFNEKRKILHLLDKSLNTDGVKIFIGEESHYESLGNYSLITAPYSVDGKVLGALGVIGPTRMPYEDVIPIVDITAKLMSTALNFNS